MKIQIAARFRPFSHLPGASCVLPGSCVVIEAFPTLLRIGPQEWKMPLTGPVHGFTLQQDLEKNVVFVFGRAKEGYFRLRLQAHDDGVQIISEKGPLSSDKINVKMRRAPLGAPERLSLGSHKAQDWDLVQRRLGLKEILPLLFFLGQKIPKVGPQKLSGTATLLQWPDKRDALEEALLRLIQAGFKGMLVPRWIDDQYQGLSPDTPTLGDPFFILQEAARQIRSLFFEQNERRLAFLPRLPISFDAGRMVGLIAPGIGTIDFEWSKKRLRRVVLYANTSGEVLFDLPKEIATFRIQRKQKISKNTPILLESNKTYHFDCFES